MILSFYTWAWREGHVPAEILLSIRSVPVPAGSTGVAKPAPYKRWKVRALWKLVDERWPLLPSEAADRWLCRWQEGRSPYSRVRSHLIHLQLEAMISLALACGMRRAEIYGCCVEDVDPANAYIAVRRRDGTVREVPFSAMARKAVAAWLEARMRVDPPHDRAWLNLWAEATAKQAMTKHAFEKVLRTYVGVGWTFRRLRDTGAVEWLRAGLEVWHLQELLGHRSMKDTLPYLEAATGSVRRLSQVEEGLTGASVSQSDAADCTSPLDTVST
jgi:integrase